MRRRVSFRGYDINSFGVKDRYSEDVWQSADMLHVVGENIRERVRRRGCPSDRPHTVITDAGHLAVPLARPDLRVGRNSPSAWFLILSVGRMHWKKGHEFGLAPCASARPHPGALPDHRRVATTGSRRCSASTTSGSRITSRWSAGRLRPRYASARWADAFLHLLADRGLRCLGDRGSGQRACPWCAATPGPSREHRRRRDRVRRTAPRHRSAGRPARSPRVGPDSPEQLGTLLRRARRCTSTWSTVGLIASTGSTASCSTVMSGDRVRTRARRSAWGR